MKKSTIILSVITFILLVLVLILGVLLLKNTSDTAKLQSSLNIVENQDAEVSDLPLDIDEVDEEDTPTEPVNTMVNFSNEAAGLSFEFPSTWDVDTKFELVDDADGMNRVLNFYTLSFIKGSTRLEFRHVYVATGAYATPFDDSEYEIVDLGDVLRTKQKGQTEWRYATQVECNEIIGFAEYCGTTVLSIPGGRMVAGVLVSNNEADIKEADAIVVDAAE